MNITITINTDNEAFADGPETEVARILANYARQLADGLTNVELASCLTSANGVRTTLRDINGNTVGQVTITD